MACHGNLILIEEKQMNAEVFLAQQRNRVGNTEKALLAASGILLPSSRESRTITELAELCRLTQDATREKLEILRSCLEDEGYTVTSPRTNRRQGLKTTITASKSSPSLDKKHNRMRTAATPSIITTSFTLGGEKNGISSQTSLPLVANIGGPLESVLEADYETDGIPTPASYLESPALSSAHNGPYEFYDSDDLATPTVSTRKDQIQNPRTPSSITLRSPDTPPTLDKLSISASTNVLLQHMENVGENGEDNPQQSSSYSCVSDASSSNHISFSKETPKRLVLEDRYHSQQQEQQQQHLHEFLDEDDMITLDTQSTMTKNNTFCSPNVTGGTSISVEERSQFFARMEGILERVEETILEECPSPGTYNRNGDISRNFDDHQATSLLFTQGGDDYRPYQHSITSMSSKDRMVTGPHRHPYTTFNGGKSMLSENDEDSGMDLSEDSTNVVATQVAGKGTSKDGIMPLVSTENDITKQNSLNIFQQRPTHILVDTGIASPAHTNITMDATFMNETSFLRGEERYEENTKPLVRGMINYDSEEDDDNLSTVTPVLDRYRLDPSDDNSIGVKVVPNKRSAHRSNQKQTTTPKQGRLPTIAQLSPSLDYILKAITPKQESNESNFKSPPIMTSERHLRSMAANSSINQNRKVYRKTPFPKRKLVNEEEDDTSRNAADENHNPNISAGSSFPDSPEPFKYNEVHFSISVPPLRPGSFESKRADESVLRLGAKRTLSLPGKNKSHVSGEFRSASFSSGASRQAYLQEETYTIQKIDETIERIDLELASPRRSSIHNTGRMDPVAKTIMEGSSKLFVNEITESEFESAPRIVRTNVSRDRANKALHAIHRYCSESMAQFHCLEFTEKEGRRIVGLSEQESKSILISLCHWRRLMMKKDATRGMIFAINNEKKEPPLSVF
jgi:hypothetical protein